jgi:hypothetical protein
MIDLDDLKGQEEEEIALPPRQADVELSDAEEVYVLPPRRNRTQKSARPPPPISQQRHQLPPSPPPPADHITRQSNVDPGPGAYRVSPARGVTRASGAISSEASVATNQGSMLSVPTPPFTLAPIASPYLVEATPIEAELAPEPAPVIPKFPDPAASEALPLSQPPPIQQQDPARWKRISLLLALGFIIIAAIVGVSVWAATRSTGAPPGPPSSSIWSQDRLMTTCSAFRDTFDNCVNYTGSGESGCERCVVSSWGADPSLVTQCSPVAEKTCSSLSSSCPLCSGCEQEFLDYFECRSQCTLAGISGCTFAPAPTPPSPAPSPSPTTDRCSTERSTFYQCVTDNQGNVSSCLYCFDSRVPKNISCAQYEPYVCSEVSACPMCGPCTAEDVAWTNCLQQGHCDPFTCPEVTTPPTAAPTLLRCPNEYNSYWTCVAAYTGGDSSECLACRAVYTNITINTCQDSQIRTCGLDVACPMCGQCEDQEVAWVNCLNGAECDPFNCSSSVNPSPSP